MIIKRNFKKMICMVGFFFNGGMFRRFQGGQKKTVSPWKKINRDHKTLE